MPRDRHSVEVMLRERGIQPTSQRVEVLYHLCQEGHRTADEIFEVLNQEFSKVSRATVYNTLNLLKEQGIIREVVLEPGRSIFDANAHEHHHFFDEDTNELIDIPPDQIALTCLPGLPEGKVYRGADVIIRIGQARGS